VIESARAHHIFMLVSVFARIRRDMGRELDCYGRVQRDDGTASERKKKANIASACHITSSSRRSGY
jgi:hypothetical protein